MRKRSRSAATPDAASAAAKRPPRKRPAGGGARGGRKGGAAAGSQAAWNEQKGDRSGGGRADGVASGVRDALRALNVDAETADALHAQVARALESGARSSRRRGGAFGKARALATHAPAGEIAGARLIPLVLAVRDALKTGPQGSGGASRARIERLDRAADAAVRTLAESTPAAGDRPGRSGGRAGGKNAQRHALETSREMLQRLVRLTPDAVFTVRASGRLGLWNVAASRISGRRRWEIQRRGLASLFRPHGTYERLLRDVDARGRVVDLEATLLNAAGDEVPVRIFAVRLKPVPPQGANAGRPAPSGESRAKLRKQAPGGRDSAREVDAERHLLILHDLTEVHRIRRRLIETEKLSAMAKIAGSVAHEFRNPLNSLFLTTDLLEDELEGREEVRESIAPTLAAIREEIERLNQIITHYLSLSKISSASPEVMDLGQVVGAFAEELRGREPGLDADLRVRTEDADHRITADPNQVRRVLVNLFENAVDAVRQSEDEEEGRTRPGTVTFLVRRMRRSVKLTVKDNGTGIPDEIRNRVFEPFFTSKAGGSGLGLYLVREIARASGGTMTLSSAPGRGTSVSIRWPFAREPDGESD